MSTQRYHFGPFQLSPETGELSRNGERIPLPRQPVQILCLLVERPGALITREQIREALWPDTHIDYDQAINGAIRKIRQALGDDVQDPVYIETLPRLGYRFIAPAERQPAPAEAPSIPRRPDRRTAVLAAVLSVLGGLTLAAIPWSLRSLRNPSGDGPTGSLEAYRRGQYLLQRDDEAALDAARRQFEAALDRAPDHAAAYTGLASALLRSPKADPERRRQARRSLTRALALAPESGEAHALRGELAAWADWDGPAAERAFRRALELEPDLATAHEMYGAFLNITGRPGEALAHMNRAVELAPASPRLLIEAGSAHLYAGRAREAVRLCTQAIQLAPATFGGHRCRSQALWALGDLDAARASYVERARVMGAPAEVAEEMKAADPQTAYRIYHRWRVEETRRTVENGRGLWTAVGVAHAALGETDRALEALERALERRESVFLFIAVDPRVEGLRGDPRFQALLRRTGILDRPRKSGSPEREPHASRRWACHDCG